MKSKISLILFFSVFFALSSFAQSPVGTWKTVDDQTEEAKSHVQIFEKGGKLHGKIVQLLLHEENAICEKCPDDKKDKPVLGMEIIWGMKTYKDYWSYGEVLDPESGSTYKCNIWLEGKDILKVRGYVGIAALGRTQTWYRVK